MSTKQLYAQEVDAAIKMDEHFHDWSAKFSPEAALLFAEKSEIYNRMTRTGLVGLINFINDVAPSEDYGPTNPNTNRPCHEYLIGNEGSRVIYVYFNTHAVKKSLEEWGEILKKIETFAKKKAHADEFDVIPGDHDYHRWGVRIWFD